MYLLIYYVIHTVGNQNHGIVGIYHGTNIITTVTGYSRYLRFVLRANDT